MGEFIVESISKSFGKQEVLKRVSLQVEKGEIFGLLGPSGSGKTTLVRLMMGMEKWNEGVIRVQNLEVPNRSVIEKIGYMAQSDALYIDLTAEENMKFYCELYGMKKATWNEAIEYALSIVNLQDNKKKVVSSFSGGMKRRLSLAIALVHRPEMLILDEPTVGMDPVLRRQIWNELHTLSENGTTILLTTHVMDEAEKCHRLAMIRDGHIIAMDSPKRLLETTNCSTIEDVFLQLGGMTDEN